MSKSHDEINTLPALIWMVSYIHSTVVAARDPFNVFDAKSGSQLLSGGVVSGVPTIVTPLS